MLHNKTLLVVMAGLLAGALMLAVAARGPRHEQDLEKALAFAGKNRGELEKVLDHYKAPKDSLKLEAARFLIRHMPYHVGYYGTEVNNYASIFAAIDTLSYLKESLSFADKKAIGEAVVSRFGWPQVDNLQPQYDSRILSASYLISNIEFAVRAWKGAPWADKVPFAVFCEYILPYRIKAERAEYWRPEFYQRYTGWAKNNYEPRNARSVFDDLNWKLNTETSFNVFFDKYYPFDQSIGDVEKGRIGSCEITAYFATSAMRAAGLPVGYDYIMHWGSTNSRHYMPHLVGKFDSLRLITNENVQENTWHLVDFSSEFNEHRHQFTPEEMPPGLYVQNVRTIPKVYRYQYSQNVELVEMNKNTPASFVCPEFTKTNFKDVTDEYVTTTTVTIPVTEAMAQYKLAYLTVFDISGWQAVAVAPITAGKAVFEKLGRQTMYLPTVYHEGKHWPAGAPFYIDAASQVHQVKASNKTTDMRVLRKYPLYTYTAYHSEILKGGHFEGANDAVFTHPTVLHRIANYPFFVNEVSSASKDRFRYLRYVAAPEANFEPDNIAEVQFIGVDGKPLTGQVIGMDGIAGHEPAKAFDGDLNSYYQNARNRDGWIGIDLGPGKRAAVGSIRFCPRNDTNGILPDSQYELFYWNGTDWISLGVAASGQYRLDYKGVPAGALFWLKCLTGGQEERIFTYENGLQTWW
ncbi:discoidin domain-containing protein [Paraflavitalea pollutisoli]|uniref:discoidin domain-containing protein n=1 Tax=Paraflavitalea pollutisoli TaxID=3034143 RepID=UPI0023EBAF69|nr:discoidin domain-containing protein [Paraflavitalea sp. H1-2-19X]